MEPYQSAISSSALEKINRMLLQKKVAGKQVEPWEFEAALKAEMGAEADRASLNYTRNKELSLREQGMAADQDFRERQLASGEKASMMGGIGNLATTGLMAERLGLFGKGSGTEGPGMISKGFNSVKSMFNGPTTTPTVPTTPAYSPGLENYSANTVDATGNLIEGGSEIAAGLGESGTAAIGGATPAASGTLTAAESAELAGLGASTAGNLGSAAGATATGILSTAAPYVAAAKIGMPLLGQYTADAFGGNPSNLGVKFSKAVGRGIEGGVTPLAEEVFGWDVPDAAQVIMNPAGYLLKDTWLCTEVSRYTGLTVKDNADLQVLRRYCVKNHKEWIREYLEKGKALVMAINETLPAKENRVSFYSSLKEELVLPVLEFIRNGYLEDAFDHYKQITIDLVKKYAPGIVDIPAE